VVVSLIGDTNTSAGLRIQAALDAGQYPKGIKVSNAEMKTLQIDSAQFHGEWNDTIRVCIIASGGRRTRDQRPLVGSLIGQSRVRMTFTARMLSLWSTATSDILGRPRSASIKLRVTDSLWMAHMRPEAISGNTISGVLLQEWQVIWYNEPDSLDPRSPETGHERSLPVQMAPL